LEEDEEGTDLTAEITLEKKRRYLDEINALYVTCTRAVMRLYFIQEKGLSAFNHLLDQTLCELFPEYKQTGVAETGVLEHYITDLSKATPLHVPTLKGKEVLFPRLRLRSIRERDTPEILYGKLLHECFSLIIDKSDVDHIVERILLGRSDADSYRQRLLNDLQKIISDTISSDWFDGKATALCERELIANDGSTLRPDRVIVREDCVVVVDYKTGKESRKHAEQVNHYKSQLQNIYNLPVEGYLLYTTVPKIVAV
jgi:ATP-dependent exoDNAse (exonuclease V) beta subunit